MLFFHTKHAISANSWAFSLLSNPTSKKSWNFCFSFWANLNLSMCETKKFNCSFKFEEHFNNWYNMWIALTVCSSKFNSNRYLFWQMAWQYNWLCLQVPCFVWVYNPHLRHWVAGFWKLIGSVQWLQDCRGRFVKSGTRTNGLLE